MGHCFFGALVYAVFVWRALSVYPGTYTLQPLMQQSTVGSNCSNVSQLLDTLNLNLANLMNDQVAICMINGIGSNSTCPASSCKELANALPNKTSGYYWISSNYSNTSFQVYCDLTRYLNGSRGWMRVAYLNMSDPSQSCPYNWTNYTAGSYRLCGRSGDSVCFGVSFTTYSIPYYKVSGWIYGFQFSSNDGFKRYGTGCSSPCTIDGPYVDGVSITYGSSPRKHLWSYAASQSSGTYCPCYTGGSYANTVPSFVGTSWYCGGSSGTASTYYNFPLWQPGTCSGQLTPCCNSTNLPWFYATVTANVTDSLEVRICGDEGIANEDVRLRNLELYVY